MLNKWLWSVAPVALLASSVAFAQTAAAEPPNAKAGSTQGSAATQNTGGTDASTSGIETVVVTAEKRSEDIQHVPQAVTVLDGATQALKGQTGLADLQLTVPNLTYSYTSNTSQFFIRGVGDVFINAGGDPGVAFYQDDAYVSDQTTTNTSMFDVERTEVLLGPQGALYGRNAVGGAINVISNKPTDTWSASVNAVLGDYGRADSEGYVSGPLGIADTDFRVAYQLQNNDGYTKNLLAGQPGAPDTLNDLHSTAFRAQTLTQLPTGGTLDVMYSYYHEDDNGPALSVKPTPGIIYPAQALFGVAPTPDPRATYANFGSYSSKVSDLNLHYIQPIGSDTLTVVGNYRSSAQTMLDDADGTSADGQTYFRTTSGEDYYADAHLSSPDDSRFRWLIGGTYVHFTTRQKNFVDSITEAAYFNPAAPTSVPLEVILTNGGAVTTQSFAAYADLRYEISKIFAVTGQIRYNNTTKSAAQNLTIVPFGVNFANYTGPGSHLRNTNVPFKVGIEAHVNDDVMFYANYATAHRDGAINLGALQPTPVKPEDLQSFEIGEKGTFLNDRLVLNADYFDSKYSNLQISQIVATGTVLTNVPKSTIRGAELQAIALPFEDLTLSANVGYMDAKFVNFTNSPAIPGGFGPPENLAGNELPYDAKWNVNLDATYKFPVTDRFVGTADLQYSWRDREYFTEFNTDLNSQGAIGVVNFSWTLSPNDGPWQVFGYIRNLTNVTALSGLTIYSDLGGAQRAVNYIPPRQYAIGVSYKY